MDIETAVQHGYADSKGVKIHFASLGSGPLVVMLHGFPDFWYTWRRQMAGLSEQYQCVALDMRGYNLSDKPKGEENYRLKRFCEDAVAVIRHLGQERAIICGHDWGGATAWRLAIQQPEHVERLIILNCSHPRGLARELTHNPLQRERSQYARDFQKEGAHLKLTAEYLARWVRDADAKKKYIEAFERSDYEAMLHYYKASYPREPYQELPDLPKVTMPVLLIFGLQDTAFVPEVLNDTWKWVDNDFTLVTVPGAGHFVQQDAADLVTRSIKTWLRRDK